MESHQIATWAGNVNNIADNVYPGFMRATPESDEREWDYLGQLAWIQPLSRVPAQDTDSARPFGYIPLHILSIEPIDDGYRAYVCKGSYAVDFESESHPGTFVSVAADAKTGGIDDPLDTVDVFRIELNQDDPRIPSGAADVTTPQEGPAPAPDDDVFGRWFITGVSNSVWGPINAKPADFFVTDEMRRQCQQAMPDSPEKQIEMATGFKDEPPPHGSPVPGWPVAPQ